LPSDTLLEADLTLPGLYEQFEAVLRRYAVGLTRDPDRSDDLVQETFIRAMRHMTLLARLEGPQRRAWLYRTLRNLFLDQERARRRRDNLVVQLVQQAEESYIPFQLNTAREILSAIPEHYREVLEHKYLRGMTSREIAGELGIPAGTVRSRLRLAQKWLQKHQSELV
jgi:RNA polymerase sigma-70 factor (ECF subfamily)